MKVSYLMIAALIVFVLSDIVLLNHNRSQEDDWASYRDEHHCTPVAVTDGSNRAGYQCDDGQIHYRWRQMR